MMDKFLQDFFDMLFDLFRFLCVTFELLGILGGIFAVVVAFYLGATPKGQCFLRWLNDEFGL